MAVMLEFLNLIIPRSVIENKYRGGWLQCLEDECGMWHDDHLLRDGAMSAVDIEKLVQFWEAKGLRPMKTVNGGKVWNDLCVIEALSVVPTLPCDWIEVSEDGTHAWLKGFPAGTIVGPNYNDLCGNYTLGDDV